MLTFRKVHRSKSEKPIMNCYFTMPTIEGPPSSLKCYLSFTKSGKLFFHIINTSFFFL